MGSYNFSVGLQRSCNHIRKDWLVYTINKSLLVAFKKTNPKHTGLVLCNAWGLTLSQHSTRTISIHVGPNFYFFRLLHFYFVSLQAITLHHNWAKLRLLHTSATMMFFSYKGILLSIEAEPVSEGECVFLLLHQIHTSKGLSFQTSFDLSCCKSMANTVSHSIVKKLIREMK